LGSHIVALVRPESLPHGESINDFRHSAEGSRYGRTAASTFEVKAPNQDFSRGEVTHVLDFDSSHTE
jgi:hypothetical protein